MLDVSDALIGLAPVVAFLGALVWMDSYKLVGLRTVMIVVALGIVAALVAYFVNGTLLTQTSIDRPTLSRYIAPLIEELLKSLIVVGLIRANRIGFLVDAAILGFAAGTGFALVENLQYQRLAPDAGIAIWIVRGFGTAIMHGGVTAIFAMVSVAMLERERPAAIAFIPGFVIATALHALYNQGFVAPLTSTIAVLAVVPALMYFVFVKSERAIGDWLGRGFDADSELLQSIRSDRFPDSPAGRYLETLRERFKGEIVADLICYLRLNTELAMRAKGLLLMRQNGFDTPLDDETRAKFDELRFLERSIGRTGVLALQPLLRTSRRELWQMHVLE
ncbi:MAG TPA: PrsW family glutamic-type intramembrane protease [Casimicrobiaceae bacterium]|nr:PrsW family glutamic-type intramembrane protease [Casimicrobiaceae bacterium]